MKRLKFPVLIMALLATVITICSVLGVFDSVFDNWKQSVEKYRPDAAWDYPDFSGEITDIRVSAVERKVDTTSWLPGEKESPIYGLRCLQIYYGYEMDGIWYDMPCENFDLRGITKDAVGYDAAQYPHLVRIGPYLLISVCVNGSVDDCYTVVSDTLNSTATPMFEEYFTSQERSPSEPGFGYLKENLRHYDEDGKVDCIMYAGFDRYYYLVLEYASIPGDYLLTVQSYHEDRVDEWTLDYEEIQRLLKKT